MIGLILYNYYIDVMVHNIHLHQMATDMYMETIFPFPYNIHALLHRIFVFKCCDKCPSSIRSGPNYTSYETNMCPTNVYVFIYWYHTACYMADNPMNKKQYVGCFKWFQQQKIGKTLSV